MKKLFNPASEKPFPLSRSKIDLFLACPRCFYLDRRRGVKRPPGFPFNLNKAVDTLLKKEFDVHRAQGTSHPLMAHYGIEAVPFDHEQIQAWRSNFMGVRYVHKPTNFEVFGALDDVWVNNEEELMVVDYKATSKNGEVNIDADWQISYKRQMEVYQWLLRRNGFKVSDTGYFVYCNGRADRAAFDGRLEFDVVIIPYTGSVGWVEEALVGAKESLMGAGLPVASADCEYCSYRFNAARIEVK